MHLNNYSTANPDNLDKEKTKMQTEELIKQMIQLQDVLMAQRKFSLLIVIQGMDASGKDGLVKKVFSGVNPMGCRVKSFKAPTEEELSRDFLWRVHALVPEKGMIQIFNRSHYEDILITRVHAWIDDKTAQNRIRQINDFEFLLTSNHTVILKFYLHISQQEQHKRLRERMNDPTKQWKYNEADWAESQHWQEYMRYYEEAIEHCSEAAPWHIIPSDHNWVKEYLVAKKIVETLKQLPLAYPGMQ
jgi:PPK2 family polyphosphate:nucleotide phosphotransferase